MNGTKIALIIIASAMVNQCNVGEGKGQVYGCIFSPGCGMGESVEEFNQCNQSCSIDEKQNCNYSLEPTFFSAEPFEDGSLEVRIQHGGYWMNASDGLIIIIPDYKNLSKQIEKSGSIEKTIHPWNEAHRLPPEERFSASFYLNESCKGDYTSFANGSGTLRLHSLWRPNSEISMISGEFDLVFQDMRVMNEGERPQLHVIGDFKFEYQRGLPAQHFQ